MYCSMNGVASTDYIVKSFYPEERTDYTTAYITTLTQHFSYFDTFVSKIVTKSNRVKLRAGDEPTFRSQPPSTR